MQATLLLLNWLLPLVNGHSYLAMPASRNLLANLAGEETCPHCLQSGGPDNVKERGGGVWPTRLAPESHGLCGDPVQGKDNPPTFKDETYLKKGPITATYHPGEIVEFQIAVFGRQEMNGSFGGNRLLNRVWTYNRVSDLIVSKVSTHHMGHYEFRICDRALDVSTLSSAAEGQSCLDQWLLQRAPPLADCQVNDQRGDCQPIDPKHPERWFLGAALGRVGWLAKRCCFFELMFDRSQDPGAYFLLPSMYSNYVHFNRPKRRSFVSDHFGLLARIEQVAG